MNILGSRVGFNNHKINPDDHMTDQILTMDKELSCKFRHHNMHASSELMVSKSVSSYKFGTNLDMFDVNELYSLFTSRSVRK